MLLRLVVDDDVVYEGDPIPVPRVGERLNCGDESRLVEAAGWHYQAEAVVVTVVVGAQPYVY